MIDPHFVFVGMALGLVGSGRYAWLTLKGRTRPNRVSWFLWALAPFIGFAAQLDRGVGLSSVLTLSVGIGPTLILIASFVSRHAYWRVTRFDLACGLVALAALVVWLTLDDPTLAVVFAVIADLVGGTPTFLKCWRDPHTEHPLVFVFAAVNGTIALLTIDQWSVATWAFPVYVTALGVSLTAILLVQGRRHPVSPPVVGTA